MENVNISVSGPLYEEIEKEARDSKKIKRIINIYEVMSHI